MPPDGTLLVIEMVIPDDPHLAPAHLSDLNMLVMTGGKKAQHGSMVPYWPGQASASRASSRRARRMTC